VKTAELEALGCDAAGLHSLTGWRALRRDAFQNSLASINILETPHYENTTVLVAESIVEDLIVDLMLKSPS
jgi:hypothetical protein